MAEIKRPPAVIKLEAECDYLLKHEQYLPKRLAALNEFKQLLQIKFAEVSQTLTFLRKYMNNFIEFENKRCDDLPVFTDQHDIDKYFFFNPGSLIKAVSGEFAKWESKLELTIQKRQSNIAQIEQIERSRNETLANAVGTLRKLETFTKNHRGRAIDFEWPRPTDLIGLDCDLDTFRLAKINYKPHSCGFASLQFEFANGLSSPVFAALGKQGSDTYREDQAERSVTVKGVPCAIDAKVRGKPTDLFEAFKLLDQGETNVAECEGHTCGEYERFELDPGERIVGLYGNQHVGDGLLKAVGFIVWRPAF